MIQISKGDITRLAILLPIIHPELGFFKLEIARRFERKATFLLVASAFEWTVAQLHHILLYVQKMVLSIFVRTISADDLMVTVRSSQLRLADGSRLETATEFMRAEPQACLLLDRYICLGMVLN